ncbi:MAG: Uma2 family endonuclease [Caldilineaceae bacterium]|nr:Uma2 family endonuclease [Caldilineaceae bacterium]
MAVAVRETVHAHQAAHRLPDVISERPLHRFTLDEYHWLIENGFFQPEDRLELIEGYLVETSPLGPPHAGVVDSVMEELVAKVKRRAKVRIQQPITLPQQTTEPEPDFVLARRTDTYRARHPFPEDILLVGEVSDSTLAYDRGKKARLYAEAGIQEYWIVNVIDGVLEVYRDPIGSGNNADYRTKLTYTADETVTPLALPNCRIDLVPIFYEDVDDVLAEEDE